METMTIHCDRRNLVKVPTTNGIYIFEKNGKPLYIGKSVNLKARLISHFENAKVDPKSAGYVNASDKIRLILTDSEFTALLLESELISKYVPKYNVRFRDDKSYLYIKLTAKDTYPKFFVTRKEHQKGAVYFGPFQSVRITSTILREIRKVLPFCTQKKITKQRCFYAKIHLCHPCPNVIEKTQDENLKKMLTKQYSDNIRQATRVLKGNINAVSKILYKQIDELTKKQLFEEAIIYRNRLLKLEGLVSQKRFGSDQPEYYNNSEVSLESLQKLLLHYFPEFPNPKRIECYDISNLSFKDATASMVVFTEGLSDKKEYKRFKIKNQKAQSDFEMIEEVLMRRLKNNWEKPDLIVIDGGRPQVKTVLRTLKLANIKTPVIGIAKRPDRLIIGNVDMRSIRPRVDHPGFRMIQALRDESHRFARKYHLYLRSKKMV